MMKRILSVALLAALLSTGASAQKGAPYNTAVGLQVDLGTGGTWVGPAVKHFFSAHDAGEAQILFASGAVILGLEYQYNGAIANAPGLRWYAGLGPALAFSTAKGSDGGTDLFLRPIVGMDYKIPSVPLDFAFDWRPAFQATHGTSFTAARFGLGFRYAF